MKREESNKDPDEVEEPRVASDDMERDQEDDVDSREKIIIFCN